MAARHSLARAHRAHDGIGSRARGYVPRAVPRIIFAALDAAIARELEPRFADAGCAVVSNSSAYRMAPNVPLVIPEVNAEHLHLIEEQPSRTRMAATWSPIPTARRLGW